MTDDMTLTEAAGILRRPDYIELKITRHLAMVQVNGAVFTRHGWRMLCEAEDLPLLDRASGWTDVVAGGNSACAEAGEPLVFRFCPDLIADTTNDLDVLNESWCVSLYVDLVEHIVDIEVAEWTNAPDSGKRRSLAENAVYHILDDAADEDDPLGPVEYPEGTPMALLSQVQGRALSLLDGQK